MTHTDHEVRPRILLADREPRMRRALRRLIGEQQFVWVEAASARELLSNAPDPDIRLVILDEQLPGVDLAGTGLALRAAGCQAPLLVVTNRAPFADPGNFAAPAGALAVSTVDRLRVGSALRDTVRSLLAERRYTLPR